MKRLAVLVLMVTMIMQRAAFSGENPALTIQAINNLNASVQAQTEVVERIEAAATASAEASAEWKAQTVFLLTAIGMGMGFTWAAVIWLITMRAKDEKAFW